MLEDKKERLKEMRKRHARERAEVRENEMYVREGEDMRILDIREKMAGVLSDPKITSEERKSKLAFMKESIDAILYERAEREHAFIEEELKHHQMEQELEQEIEEEERKKNPKPEKPIQLRTPFIVAAEQMRKTIEENRKDLNEEEQFSTILINTGERGSIPAFTKTPRLKELEPPPRIDTIVVKQREIGMLYRESRDLQESYLNKNKTPPIEEQTEELDDTFEETVEEEFEEFEKPDNIEEYAEAFENISGKPHSS